jgi:hypothetical protein
MFSVFPLSRAFVGLVAYKTAGSPGMGCLWSENRPSDLDEIVARMSKRSKRRTRRKKSERVCLPTGGCVQLGTRFVYRPSQIAGQSVGAVKAGPVQKPKRRGECLLGPDPECRTRGRIWRHSLIGAQYFCGFRRADVCPIPPEHSRRLRSTLGRIRYPVQGRFHQRIYRVEFAG